MHLSCCYAPSWPHATAKGQLSFHKFKKTSRIFTTNILLLLMFTEMLAGQFMVQMTPVNDICGRNFELLKDTASYVDDI